MPRDPIPDGRYLRWGRRDVPRSVFGLDTDVHGFFFARNAIYHAMGVLGIAPPGRVLVPAYVCRAAIDPLLSLGIACDFYAVDSNGVPDFASIDAATRPETRGLLAVHYFGFPCPIVKLRQYCDDRGLALIEDCAHVLTGKLDGVELGSVGDVSVFSWRKFLPIADGALLRINRGRRPLQVPWQSHPFGRSLKVAYRQLEAVANRSENPPWWRFVLELAERRRKAPAPSPAAAQTAPALDTTSIDFDLRAVNWPITGPSAALLHRSDIHRIEEQRRANYRALAALLREVPNVELMYPTIDDALCAWVLPIRIAGVERGHLPLRVAGIPAVTWEGVRPGGWIEGIFHAADVLYRDLVMLPVHQNLSSENLRTVADAVRRLAVR